VQVEQRKKYDFKMKENQLNGTNQRQQLTTNLKLCQITLRMLSFRIMDLTKQEMI